MTSQFPHLYSPPLQDRPTAGFILHTSVKQYYSSEHIASLELQQSPSLSEQ